MELLNGMEFYVYAAPQWLLLYGKPIMPYLFTKTITRIEFYNTNPRSFLIILFYIRQKYFF